MIPSEFKYLVEVSDGPEVVHDPLTKFFENAECAGALHHPRGFAFIEGVHAEATERTARIAEHYKKVFTDGEKKHAAATKTTTPAPATLAKRFSSDEKAGYRKYFQENLEKGKTVSATLNEWLETFPNANPSVEKLMREVCAEFA